MAAKGLRTLVFAYREYDIDEWNQLETENNNFINEADRGVLEQELTFFIAFGLKDELREGVTEVIGKLNAGNINVRMFSGDNMETAKFAARQAGILLPGDDEIENCCMMGYEFRE
jgi:magnesium-transporting ATPase (P-type)